MKLKKRYWITLGFLAVILLAVLGYYSTFKEYKGRKAFQSGHQLVDDASLFSARKAIKTILSFSGDYLYVKGYEANLRSAPDTSAVILLKLKHNNYCKILDQSTSKTNIGSLGSDYWYKVKTQNQVGWVFGKLVQLETDNYPKP